MKKFSAKEIIKQFDCFWLYEENLDFVSIYFWYVPEKYRNIPGIESCSDSVKEEIDQITNKIYQCLRKEEDTMIGISTFHSYPSSLRLTINSNLTRDVVGNILEVIKSFGFVISSYLSKLLVSGGDSRQSLDDSGKNYILLAPEPESRDIVYRSSCTGSQISKENYKSMLALHQKLKSAEISFQECMSSVHNRIRNILTIDNNTTLISIPSGTEAEYIPLLFAKAYAGYDCNIVNIVTGVGEIGSQSHIAAEGLYFATSAPSGAFVSSGDKISGISQNVTVISVPFKPNNQNEHQNEYAWLNQVHSNISSPNTLVLLHIVDSSKLGRRMDVIPEVEQLRKQYPEKLLVVIDSCQSRTDASLTRKYLKLGYMVMITGSKFEQGPPFSGCVIIPSTITNKLNERSFHNLLSGLKDFITKYDISGDANIMKDYLPSWMNFGLMMRWQCALNNWEKYRAIEESFRNRIIQEWVDRVIELIHQYKNLEHFYGGEIQNGAVGERNTIISFKLKKKGRPMTIRELKKIYKWLNESVYTSYHEALTEKLDIATKKTLNKRFLIGQPVDMGNFAVLRIAIGARMVCDIAKNGIHKTLVGDNHLLYKIVLLINFFEQIHLAETKG